MIHRIVAVLLLISCARETAVAQIESFGPGQLLSSQAIGAADVETPDLDGDGLRDVLVASVNDDTVGWFKNLGGGAFSPRIVITNSALGARVVAAADIDNDGDSDVVVGSLFDRVLGLYENLGGGSFAPLQVLGTVPYDYTSLALADLNDDGKIDLLVSASFRFVAGRLSWFPNLGGGSFGPELLLQQGFSVLQEPVVSDAHPADLDGDGDLDVLVATEGTGVFWLENTGNGVFAAAQSISAGPLEMTRVRAVDLDDDGDLDVLVADTAHISAHENLGGGGFGPERILANAGNHLDIVLADLDDDGDEDVVTATIENGWLDWYENLGDFVFSPRIGIATASPGLSGLTVSKLDADESLDIVTTSFSSDTVAWRKGYLHLADHSLLAADILRVNERAGSRIIALGDLDGDGLGDLVFGGPEANRRKGRLHAWSPATGQELWSAEGGMERDLLGSSLAVAGDVDGDGRADVVAGMPERSQSQGRVAVYSGANGALLFSDDGIAAGDLFGEAVAGGGDWNGDGVPDYAAGSSQHSFLGPDSGYVRVYSGATGLALDTLFGLVPLGEFGRGVAFVSDRDGDGKDELLVAHRQTTGLGALFLLQGGSGAVIATITVPGAGADFGKALAADRDLNGDGVPEILVGDAAAQGGDGGAWLLDGATMNVLRSHAGATEAALGTAVAFVNDVNGDGQGDYAIGAPGFVDVRGVIVGRVNLVDGATGMLLNGVLAAQGVTPQSFEGGAYTGFGCALAGLGDLDGDGYAEFAAGLPFRSRVWIYGGLNPSGLYGPCAQGTAGDPVLSIDGSVGGGLRRVTIPSNTSFLLSVAAPSTNPISAPFAVAGYLGVPALGQETMLPYDFGTLCIPSVGVDPAAFLLTDNLDPSVPQLVTSTPAPWSLAVPGIPVRFTLTFQGVIFTAPGTLRTTNALVLSVLP